MTEPKTRPTGQSVERFLDKIPDEQRRQDCFALVELMRQAAKADPEMWGPSIVGFGSWRCTYASGRELDWPMIAFSPRKQSLVLYLMPGFDQSEDLLRKLGKHSVSKSCLYIKKLADVDVATLKRLVQQSVKRTAKSAASRGRREA